MNRSIRRKPQRGLDAGQCVGDARLLFRCDDVSPGIVEELCHSPRVISRRRICTGHKLHAGLTS